MWYKAYLFHKEQLPLHEETSLSALQEKKKEK